MKVYLELAVFVIIILILLGWSVWSRWSLKKARKNYNPDDDLGKKAEKSRREGLETEGEGSGETSRDDSRGSDRKSPETVVDESRSTTVTEQELFPPTAPPKSGKNSVNRRKNSKSPRGFFGKFRRKRKG